MTIDQRRHLVITSFFMQSERLKVLRNLSCVYNLFMTMHIKYSSFHFIPAISIAPLQVLYYSEALPTTAIVSRRSAQAAEGKGFAQGPYVAARAAREWNPRPSG